MVNRSKFLIVLLLMVLVVGLSSGRTSPGSVVSDLQELAMIPDARGDLKDLQDLPKYEIEMVVNLDEQNPGFKGEETITFTNNEGIALESLYLRLYPNGHEIYGNGSLEVTQVLVESEEAQPILRVEGTVVEVPLPVALEPKERIKL
ncbi:MAG TPA: hypothetical protein EYP17_11640, partial [Candidatus Latescibacteria bacterium]|nr:hypothetical protein [Candidatus Latescibacterota bacterium]